MELDAKATAEGVRDRVLVAARADQIFKARDADVRVAFRPGLRGLRRWPDVRRISGVTRSRP